MIKGLSIECIPKLYPGFATDPNETDQSCSKQKTDSSGWNGDDPKPNQIAVGYPPLGGIDFVGYFPVGARTLRPINRYVPTGLVLFGQAADECREFG